MIAGEKNQTEKNKDLNKIFFNVLTKRRWHTDTKNSMFQYKKYNVFVRNKITNTHKEER